MKKIRKEQGITLIALIITIIVLLILALVTINAIQGDGDLIAYANNAGSKYTAEGANENSLVQNALAKLNKYGENEGQENEYEQLLTLYNNAVAGDKNAQKEIEEKINSNNVSAMFNSNPESDFSKCYWWIQTKEGNNYFYKINQEMVISKIDEEGSEFCKGCLAYMNLLKEQFIGKNLNTMTQESYIGTIEDGYGYEELDWKFENVKVNVDAINNKIETYYGYTRFYIWYEQNGITEENTKYSGVATEVVIDK